MAEFQFFTDINNIIEKLYQHKRVTITGLYGSALSLFIFELAQKISQIIFVTTPEKIERFHTELAGLITETICIDDTNPYFSSAKVIITNKEFLKKEVQLKEKIEITKNRRIDLDEFLQRLAATGYTREMIVEEEQEYALRGGVLDIYGSGHSPMRIEFYGDTVFSIRKFDTQTQRSIADVEAFSIELAKTNYSARLIELLRPESLIISDESLPLLSSSMKNESSKRLNNGRNNRILITTIEQIKDHNISDELFEIQYAISAPRKYFGDLKALREDIERKEYAVKFLISRPRHLEKVRSIFGEIAVSQIPLLEGFINEDEKIIYLTETEIFSEIKRRKEKYKGLFVDDLKGLKENDYVVHADFGIGQFKGLTTFDYEGRKVECLRIDYADGDKVYQPIEKINLVERYVGLAEKPPKLSKLGSETWLVIKARVKKMTEKLAIDLLNLYAQRILAKGFSYSPNSLEMVELESTFPYEETPDQRKAINDVMQDMESSKPQDRLVCGDVGYGKTEIALRAAFKAALDSKQTMFLCPTTLLAFQHYNTFKKRLAPFPVRVEMISRFKKKKELAEVIQDIKEGKVDIAIGTHRLLQPDIQFKDLGLLIIDEEHRFGVLQKERIKRLKPNLDIIYLSATPIPRTLYMALTGIKDISNIYTPPAGRKEIITKIIYFDDEEIKRIIEFELNRGGQIFFVHNHIQTIETIKSRILNILPDLKLCVLHGNVNTVISEKKLREFIEGKHELLLSTAIIESGLDMPRVNTIIVNEAHKFGLADLHQLRGRVGRADIQGYAYFIIPERKITDTANRRLSALISYTSLGSGFRLALRDMEIRGIGNILGKEQSGYINAIGYHHYVKLLKTTINEIKGRPVIQEPNISVNIAGYFPGDYIQSAYERTALYKRLMDVQSEYELDSLKDELTDRFGKYPQEVETLFILSKIRLKAIDLGADEVIQKGNTIIFYCRGDILAKIIVDSQDPKFTPLASSASPGENFKF